jgi:hypothetical protein
MDWMVGRPPRSLCRHFCHPQPYAVIERVAGDRKGRPYIHVQHFKENDSGAIDKSASISACPLLLALRPALLAGWLRLL